MMTKRFEGSEKIECIPREVKTGNTREASTVIYTAAPSRTDHGAVR